MQSRVPSQDSGSDKSVVKNEITHDEYDPIGTLALIGIYFLILLFMWVFMYFVEFLGNDPTVVGSTLEPMVSLI